MSHQVLKQLPQADSISSITIAGASAGLIQVDMLLFLTKLIFKTSSILSPSKYVGLCFNVFTITRSYAALRAADLDWIIGPGYSSGDYIFKKNHV